MIDIINSEEITILDIAVDKTQQRNGIGKKLINFVLDNYKRKILIAETDGDAVDFYRKCGFQVNSLGEKYPGIIRYDCKYVNCR